jgi:hypothetical protein
VAAHYSITGWAAALEGGTQNELRDNRIATAVQLSLNRFTVNECAIVAHNCFAKNLLLMRNRRQKSLQSMCDRSESAVQSMRDAQLMRIGCAFAVQSPCNRRAIAVQSPCNRRAIAVQSLL